MGFLRRAGVRLVPDCTLLAGHVLTGKAEELSVLAERHLGLRLDKAGADLRLVGRAAEAQLRYAALGRRAVVGALLPVLRERPGRGGRHATPTS